MISDFFNYKVKVRPVPFKTNRGVEVETTASISFFDVNSKEIAYFDLAYMDVESLFLKIDTGEAIILDECFIENFSMSQYRKSRNIEEKMPVTLNEFSAVGAFFDSKIETDFSYSRFTGNVISFEKCKFLNGRTSFSAAEFAEGDKNFSNIFFRNGEIDFSNVKFNSGKVDFSNTVFFEGIKNFIYTDFGSGKVSFENTKFGEGQVNFINVNFGEGNVSFKLAEFGAGKIDFHFSIFGKGNISFERAEFGDGNVDFRKVEFNTGKVNFNRSAFGAGLVTFEASQLDNSQMTFKKTDFGIGNLVFEEAEYESSEVLFENIQFENSIIYFGKSYYKKLLLISCHLDKYVDFRVSKCEYLDLTDTMIRDIVDFTSFDHPVDIYCLKIVGIRLIGQFYIDWHRNNVKEIINRQTDTNHAVKAEQFRIIKENYDRIGNYDSEDKAYIMFKRHEERDGLQKAIERSKLSAIWQKPVFGFKRVVFDHMGLYATSPLRVFISLLIIYTIFSLLYLICPFFLNTKINCIPADMSFIGKVLNTFYYSIITFTTVGYGDCTPTGFLRVVASFEGFFGPFMMSYFTVAFARKILR